MRNIVFDMGNVLIYFTPRHFIEREGIGDPADRELLMQAVYHSPEWPGMDRGELDEPEMEAIARARLPERLHAAAHRLIWSWEVPVEPVPGMAELVRACKARGMGVYMLSNASRRQPEYFGSIPGSECFDGKVISALERRVKPDPEIYRILLSRFGLRAEDCLFVDDMPVNVSGAEAVGMKGFHFTGDVEALRRAVEEFVEA